MIDTFKKLTRFDYACILFFAAAFINGFLCAVVFIVLWWPSIFLIAAYFIVGAYIIDHISSQSDRTGYICDNKIVDDIANSLTAKIWQQILARRQSGTIYTADELHVDIKQNVKFLNDYGFKK